MPSSLICSTSFFSLTKNRVRGCAEQHLNEVFYGHNFMIRHVTVVVVVALHALIV